MSRKKLAEWKKLNQQIAACKSCPRLIQHCQKTAKEKRKSYQEWDYWGKSVPNFGAYDAELLIVGLAPAAHGANRTGRMFTGDRSGDWLYRALYKAQFANQKEATSTDDGLELLNCAVTAVCHCAPPLNKPEKSEIQNCSKYLDETFKVLPVKVMLALGGIAWKACLDYAIENNWWSASRPKFGHDQWVQLENGIYLLGSYHPSQQNTFTGRLTEAMLDQVFQRAKGWL